MAGRETFVHIVLPGETRCTVAGRLRVARLPTGGWRGEFVYGRSYLARANAVELVRDRQLVASAFAPADSSRAGETAGGR